MKKIHIILAAATLLVFAAANAMAAAGPDSKTVILKTTIASVATLTIPAAPLTFADGFDTLPGAVSTTYTANVRHAYGSPGTLTITGANLVGTGSNTKIIPASVITLTPTVNETGAVAAASITLSTTADKNAVVFNGSGVYTGNLSFDISTLMTPAAYQALPSDTYTGTQTLTLTAP